MTARKRIHTAQRCSNLAGYLKRYNYQPELTPRLDALPDEPFSQETINEIVLWKVNRYAPLAQDIRTDLQGVRTWAPKEHRRAESLLVRLLDCQGVDLPMASTFLRFSNPETFQIIDRHAYRATFGKTFPVYPATPARKKVSVYFDYLDALHALAASSGTRFPDLEPGSLRH
jgi:hypothetical protein